MTNVDIAKIEIARVINNLNLTPEEIKSLGTLKSLSAHKSDFIDRVNSEKFMLDINIQLLGAFINGAISGFEDLSKEVQQMMISQLNGMNYYSTMLGDRIADFNFKVQKEENENE